MIRNVLWALIVLQYVCLLLLIIIGLSSNDTGISYYLILTMSISNVLSLIGILLNLVIQFLPKRELVIAMIAVALMTIGNFELMWSRLVMAFVGMFSA